MGHLGGRRLCRRGHRTHLAAALAPASLTAPGALIANTVLFPLGLTHARSPAQSPLPGHLETTPLTPADP